LNGDTALDGIFCFVESLNGEKNGNQIRDFDWFWLIARKEFSDNQCALFYSYFYFIASFRELDYHTKTNRNISSRLPMLWQQESTAMATKNQH
jgi:hypothetical protein